MGCLAVISRTWVIHSTKEGWDADWAWDLPITHLPSIIGIFWIVGLKSSLDMSRSLNLLPSPFFSLQTLAITRDGDLGLPLSLNLENLCCSFSSLHLNLLLKVSPFFPVFTIFLYFFLFLLQKLILLFAQVLHPLYSRESLSSRIKIGKLTLKDPVILPGGFFLIEVALFNKHLCGCPIPSTDHPSIQDPLWLD